jgi:hypothetical protein
MIGSLPFQAYLLRKNTRKETKEREIWQKQEVVCK